MDRVHKRQLSDGGLLVISELFLPTKGGTAVWFDEVYRRLGGKEIHIVTAQVPGSDAHDADHPNSVHRIAMRRRSWLKPESLGMYLKMLVKSALLILRHRPNSIHAGRVLPEGLVALVAGKLTCRPVVIYAHGEEITTWRDPTKRRVMALTYRHADRVIANSDFTKDALNGLGVRPDHISKISPGVDTRRFKPGSGGGALRASLGLGSGDKLILSVGRLSRRKGFDQVIRALAELDKDSHTIHYAIIGVGEDKQYLLDLAKACGVGSRVTLLGHVGEADLPNWYNACDVFAMPNRNIDGDTEGFGMVFLEAAACGKPVIAGQDGGTADAVVDGDTGIRVDGADLSSIVDAIAKILSDPGVGQAFGRRGMARARELYDWSAVARTTSGMNQSVCGAER